MDKGTFDAVQCGPGGAERARAYVAEVLKCLRPGGWLVQISDEPPETRLAALEEAGLKVDLQIT